MRLSEEMALVATDYLNLVGFPVSLKKDKNVPFSQSWIGRDCEKASAHL